jgi:hypothetical protein
MRQKKSARMRLATAETSLLTAEHVERGVTFVVSRCDRQHEGADGGSLLPSPDDITIGLPLVRSVAIPVGTAALGEWRTAALVVREPTDRGVEPAPDRCPQQGPGTRGEVAASQ